MKKRNILPRLAALVLALALALGACAITVLAAGEAQAFVSAVGVLEGYDTETELEEKHEALLLADEALEAYLAIDGNTVNDSAVSSAYKRLTAVKTEMFVKYVDMAYEYNEDDDYPNTRKYLDRADALVDDIDRNDKNASALVMTFTRLEGELKDPESTCASFILRVNEAKAAKSFAEIKSKYEAALYLDDEITLVGYEGVEEARAALEDIETYIIEAIISAADFITAVDNIYSEESVSVGVKKAKAAYSGLDPTIDGVPEAKERLDFIIRSHSKAATAGNNVAKETSMLVYSLVLGNASAKAGGDSFDIGEWFNGLFEQITSLFN